MSNLEDRKQLSNYVIDYVLEKSLNEVFGEASASLIYYCIENDYHLKREDIPENLESFFSSLEKMYGFGAKVFKKIVLKRLHMKLGLRYEEKKGYSVSDYVEELKNPKHLKVDEKKVRITGEQPPEPADGDKQEKMPEKRIQRPY